MLHEEMLGIIDSPKKVQDIVNVIARCRKGIKQFQQQGEVEEFPSLPKEKTMSVVNSSSSGVSTAYRTYQPT